MNEWTAKILSGFEESIESIESIFNDIFTEKKNDNTNRTDCREGQNQEGLL